MLKLLLFLPIGMWQCRYFEIHILIRAIHIIHAYSYSAQCVYKSINLYMNKLDNQFSHNVLITVFCKSWTFPWCLSKNMLLPRFCSEPHSIKIILKFVCVLIIMDTTFIVFIFLTFVFESVRVYVAYRLNLKSLSTLMWCRLEMKNCL